MYVQVSQIAILYVQYSILYVQDSRPILYVKGSRIAILYAKITHCLMPVGSRAL